ncbi:MAG: hypothetical protein AAF560_05820 [Acidobacteriota bacterium]
MRKGMWLGPLVIVALVFAGTAGAAELEGQPLLAEDAEAKVAPAELETENAQSAKEQNAAAVDGTAEINFVGFGTQPPAGFNCSCECTCRTTGAFEVQTFTLPPWTNRSCGSFNGDTCSIGPGDTCNQVRRYQNCVTL